MPVDWEDTLWQAALKNARQWAGEYPIAYSVVFGAGAVLIQAAITAGFFSAGGIVQAVLSVVIVPVALVGFMLGRTALLMLYDVRRELGEHLDPGSTSAGDPDHFSCELTGNGGKDIAVVVTNHEAAGEFHAKVRLEGVADDPGPLTLRWRNDEASPTRQINRGDSEVLTVARIRGRQAVDFLEPRLDGKDRYARVAAVCDEEETEHLYRVFAVLTVFNTRADAEGRRSHLLRLTFGNGSETATPELVPLQRAE